MSPSHHYSIQGSCLRVQRTWSGLMRAFSGVILNPKPQTLALDFGGFHDLHHLQLERRLRGLGSLVHIHGLGLLCKGLGIARVSRERRKASIRWW